MGVKLSVIDVDSHGTASIRAQVNRIVTSYPGEPMGFDSTAPKGSKLNNSQYANAVLENPLTYRVTRRGLVPQKAIAGEEAMQAA